MSTSAISDHDRRSSATTSTSAAGTQRTKRSTISLASASKSKFAKSSLKDPHRRSSSSRRSRSTFKTQKPSLGSGVSLYLKQMYALLWKGFIIRRVHYISTFIEAIGPLVIPTILVFIFIHIFARMSDSGSTSIYDPRKEQPAFGIVFDQSDFDVHYSWDNRLRSHFTIIYTPDNKETSKLVNSLKKLKDFQNAKPVLLIGVSNETVLRAIFDKVISGKFDDHMPIMGVSFDSPLDLHSGGLSYKLFKPCNNEFAKMATRRYPLKEGDMPADSKFGLYYRMAQVLAYINRDYILQYCQTLANGTAKPTTCDVLASESLRLALRRMPYPSYTQTHSTKFQFLDWIGLSTTVGYVMLVMMIVKRVIDEKAIKAKQMLSLMGMSDLVFWCSHFLNYAALAPFQAAVLVVMLFWSPAVILEHSSMLVYSGFCFLYCAQVVMFSLWFTTFFMNPILAVIASTILWVILSAVTFITLVPSFCDCAIGPYNHLRRLTALLPTASYTWFFSMISDLERAGDGLDWNNLATDQTIYGDFTPFDLISMVLLSLPMYAVLIFYLDNAWPFGTDVPKSPIFIFLPSYWCPKANRSKGKIPSRDEKKHEADPKGVASRIEICDLFKSFGKVISVDHLWLNIYERQLTVLLGHNGAGKTTTMNMITGMFAPSSGSIAVNGYDVTTATSAARRSIGLCPQENIYFKELTVANHLWLFAMLKDFPKKMIPKEITYMLRMLSLENKRNELAGNLSGGMKRKLALGIALVGDTETLILDEPTSGMDPEARRVIWDLLISIRRSRTIFLTTHYMEEADVSDTYFGSSIRDISLFAPTHQVLADRIAIMNKGQLCCSGTPMFLKSAYGTGYRLRVAKGASFSSSKFGSHLQKFFPKSAFVSEVETEVVYSLEGDKSTMMNAMPRLFEDIEKNREEHGIASCGLSYTTMEDVFLVAGSDSKLDGKTGLEEVDASGSQPSKSLMLSTSSQLLRGRSLKMSQCFGLLMKRVHFSRRYWPMFIWQLGIPAAIVTIALYFTRQSSSALQDESLFFNADKIYGSDTKTFIIDRDIKLSLIKHYEVIHQGHYRANVSKQESVSLMVSWLLDRANESRVDYMHKYLYGIEVVEPNPREHRYWNPMRYLTSWFNGEQYHSLPLSLIALFDTLLRSVIPESTTASSSSSIGFNVTSVPLYKLGNSGDKDDLMDSMWKAMARWTILCLIFMPIAFPFLGASYVIFPIKERTTKSKLLQLMTGLNPAIYWAINFAFDLATHLLATGVLFAVIFFFSRNILADQADTAFAFFLLIFAFGFATIPTAYIFSLLFASPTSGFIFLTTIYLIFGLILASPFAILQTLQYYLATPQGNNRFMKQLTNITVNMGPVLLLTYPFRFVPIFSFLYGYAKVALLSGMSGTCATVPREILTGACLIDKDRINKLILGCCDEAICESQCYSMSNAFTFDGMGAGLELSYLFLTGLLYISLIALYESFYVTVGLKFSRKKKPGPVPGLKLAAGLAALAKSTLADEDADVEAERMRIEDEVKSDKMTSLLTVHQLQKMFKNFTAVDNLSFGVKHNECFGFLGVNGAGKTTTFSILTGDLIPNWGNAFIEGRFSLLDDMPHFRKSLGYCPQFDALIEELSGDETLYLYARLRGVPDKNRKRDIDNLVTMVGLEAHRYKVTGTYSGGNKRKLSIAIALMGSPSLLMLDEPSAGVDPAARRKVWQLLGYIKRDLHCSVLLTSHSMEECEALCSRIAIMVAGKFMCLGATQHLRHKFGQGYTVAIRLARQHQLDTAYSEKVHQKLVKLIPSAVLKDVHQCDLHYHVTDRTQGWAAVFSALNQLNKQFNFEDYTVADTTLEQIFIAFARRQDADSQNAPKLK